MTRWPASSVPAHYLVFRRLIAAGAVAVVVGAVVFVMDELVELAGLEFDLWVTIRDWRPW